MLKKVFNFTLYSLTALLACFFSLILVLNFLNPAFSQTAPPAQEKLTFKKVFSDIFSNLKLILSDLNPEKKEDIKANDPPPNTPSPVSDPSSSPPAPPDSFEGDIEGAVDIPNNETLDEGQAPEMPSQEVMNGGQPSDMPAQGAVDEAQPPEMPSQEVVNEAQPSDMPAQGAVDEAQPSDSLMQDLVQNNNEEQLPSEISLEIQSDMAPFIYEAPDSRSPFENPARKEIPGKLVGEEGEVKVIVPKTPPEMYDLSEIRLKGVTWNTQSPKALFELPGGEGHYTLIKGDKIGKNGLIFEIREDEVVIVETYYKGSEDEENPTAEQVIKIKRMDRLKLNEGVTGSF